MEYTSTHKNGKSHIILAGVINEDDEACLKNLLNEIKNSKSVTFNFFQIKSINSLGVRVWVNFLRAIKETKQVAKQLIFEECTSNIIMQINMIPSFLGTAGVESFYVNYTCELCGERAIKLIKIKELPKNTIPVPPLCKKDHLPMQTEELEDEYFLFLKRAEE